MASILSCALVVFTLLTHLTAAEEDSVNKTYLKGENATLTCTVDPLSGRAAAVSPTYTWFKHEGEVKTLVATSVSGVSTISITGPLSGRATFDPPVLRIKDLKVTDSATYSCQVIGTNVKTSKTILEINAIPSVTVEVSSSPTVDEDNEYSAAVCRAAEGKPPARIVWVHTTTGQTQESSESLTTLPDGTFTVESRLKLRPGLLGRAPNSTDPVSVEDGRKNFTCRVSHEEFEMGETQLVTVPINLLYPPIVTISVKSNRLSCNAFGNPTPTITWTRPDGRTEVGRRSIYVNPKTPSTSSGRYVCVAKSSIGPEAVAAIDVQKSRDLPTLFTNALRYNASLPVKARGYEMECTAEVEAVSGAAVENFHFEWTKNEKVIEERLSPYFIQQTIRPISKEKSIVTSVLLMNDVRRNRDEGLFKCRLSMPSLASGYVRAVERSIHITVDYPPSISSLSIKVHPSKTVQEFTDVKLTCSATSRPASSYQWFFNGYPRATGAILVLRNVSRDRAGLYKCTAYNYVPGSASKEVKLTVKYPPGKVVIRKSSDKSLTCSSEGGSVPPPLYTWLLPNGTITSGNISELAIPTFDVSHATSYTCLASNGMDKTSNSTFQIVPLRTGGVGVLSVGQFVVTIIACFLLLVVAVAIIWFLRHRREWSNRGGVTKTKKEYPSSTPIPNGKSSVMSPKVEGKPALVNYVTIASKSNLALADNGFSGSDLNSKYRSVSELDGSGVEILENSSMHSSVLGKDRNIQIVPSNRSNGIPKNPVKLTTFSSPARGHTEPENPIKSNSAPQDASGNKTDEPRPITRALSEGFTPVLYNDTVRPEKHDKENAGFGSESRPDGNDNNLRKYATLNGRQMTPSARPDVVSPHLTVNNQKEEAAVENHHSDDFSMSSRRASEEHPHPPTYHQAIVKQQQGYIPGYRYNALTHEPYNTYHPDHNYRPTPAQSPRCQSVEPGYDQDYPPSMPEMTVRNYLYHPYVEARLGIPLSTQQPVPKGGSSATSPYDSGSDSAKSSGTTTTNGGRRMQSLTLV